MDEDLGVKGGHQDQLRTRRIIAEKEKKEEQEDEETKQLEEEVRKKQRLVLIRTLPIVIAGGTIKTLVDVATGRENEDKEIEYSKWKIKEYDTDFTTRGRNEKAPKKEVTIVLLDGRKVKEQVPIVEVKGKEKDAIERTLEEVPKKEKKEPVEETTKEIKQPVTEVKQSVIPIPVVPETPREEVSLEEDIDNSLSEQSKATLQRLKSRKIIDEYEKKLKDIRYELRNLVFEYNVLVGEKDQLLFQKNAEQLLDKLSDVIRKIEILKENHLLLILIQIQIQFITLLKKEENYYSFLN